MTVSSEVVKAGPFEGDGANKTFSWNFNIPTNTDIKVIYTDASGVETDATASSTLTGPFNDASGGSLQYPSSGAAIAAGTYVTIKLVLAYEQETRIPRQGGWFADVVEAAIDYVTRLILQVKESTDRAVKLRESTTAADVTFPDPLANRVIGWNAAATDLENKTPNDDAYITLPLTVSDNEVPRWNGIDALSLQTSGVFIDDTGKLTTGNATGTRADLGVPAGVTDSAGNHTFVAADRNKLIRFTGNGTGSFTAAATLGADWLVNVRADGGVVTLDPDGAEYIDGAATLTLQDGESATIYCDGTEFNAMKGSAGGGNFKGSGTEKGAGNADDIFRCHSPTLNANTTIDSGENAVVAGPLTVAGNVTLAVSGNLSVV